MEAWKNQTADLAVDSMLALPGCKQEYELVGRLSGQVDDLDFGTWTEVSALGALWIETLLSTMHCFHHQQLQRKMLLLAQEQQRQVQV